MPKWFDLKCLHLVCPIKRSQLTDFDQWRRIESGSMVEVRLLHGWSYAQQQAQTFFGANFDAGSDAGLEAADRDARRAAREYLVYRRLWELRRYPMTWEHAEKVCGDRDTATLALQRAVDFITQDAPAFRASWPAAGIQCDFTFLSSSRLQNLLRVRPRRAKGRNGAAVETEMDPQSCKVLRALSPQGTGWQGEAVLTLGNIAGFCDNLRRKGGIERPLVY